MTPPTASVRAVTIAAARIRLILAVEEDPDKRTLLRNLAVEIIDDFTDPERASLGDAMLAATCGVRVGADAA